MADGDKTYVQIPRGSTGKKIQHNIFYRVRYNNTTAYTFAKGQTGTIDRSGGGTISFEIFSVNATSEYFDVTFDEVSTYEGADPAVNANITIDSVVRATVISTTDLNVPQSQIIGVNKPSNGVEVDETGSMNIRFSEGLPQLDAWGKLRVSGATQLGDYVFSQRNVFEDNFSPVTLSGGYTDYQVQRHSIKVGVDYTVDATNGFASASTNSYHHYIAGSSHLYAGTALLNSPASTGSIRRWGLFDANNGFFFQLGAGGINAVDSTGLACVVRSSIPEAAQKDTIIPRNEWNGDKLDGNGDSGAILNLENINLWWIDIQWHGAGRTRFGTYIDGQRVICHSYYQGNNQAFAVNQTTSLPCCFSNKSTVGTTTDLYVEAWSAAVWSESDIDLRAYGSTATYASPHSEITADVSDDWQYLFSLSPRELHTNGEVNHTLYTPTSISSYAFDSAATNGLDAIVDLKMEVNSVFQGHSFTAVPNTNVELSTTGTSYEAGKVILQDMFRGKYNNVLTDTFNNFQYGAVKNFADDGGTVEDTIATISAASPAIMTTTGRLMAREPETASFPFNNGAYEITGTDNSNYDNLSVHVSPTSANTAELYSDSDLTTPIDGTVLGAATGGTIKGFQGSRVVWSFYAKTRKPIHTKTKMVVIMNWKEIIQ